ncbi:MAG: hypothetical protein REI96_18620 [Flavobacterium nitrogenifigens]|uniref:hypothetical protein n=1 Tax=Flavobacterium nitrogenifigens TaxID=1617283 RepID=UPI002806B6F6|nr:hypothetical protein [Flavobacterium nitrogenifigens]MDQ8014469.1 hypothetical protein [Flavobacterium nitrogenifigens]
MNKIKLEAILQGLKKVSKVGIYILAFVKIIDFAIETLDGIEQKPLEQKQSENE